MTKAVRLSVSPPALGRVTSSLGLVSLLRGMESRAWGFWPEHTSRKDEERGAGVIPVHKEP